MPIPAAVPIVAGLALTGGGTLASALGTKKVTLPKITTVDPFRTQARWLQEQRALLPEISGFSREMDLLSQEQQDIGRRRAAPWYDAMQAQALRLFQDYMSGGLTQAERELISSESAAKALRAGVPTSDVARSWRLGSLLRPVMARQYATTTGFPAFSSALMGNTVARPFNPASLMTNYSEVLSALTGQAQAQTQRDWYQAQLDSSRSAALASGLGNLLGGLGGAFFSSGLNSAGAAPKTSKLGGGGGQILA